MMYLGDQAVGLATSLPIFSNIAKIECGQYVTNDDILISNITIAHSLGEIPDFILIYTNTSININWNKNYLLHGYICVSSETNYATGFLRSTAGADTTEFSRGFKLKEQLASDNNFTLPSFSTDIYLKSNLTYNYIIGKFKEVTSNANE